MLLRKSERPKMISLNPSVFFGDITQALGAAWAQLSDAEKDKFKLHY